MTVEQKQENIAESWLEAQKKMFEFWQTNLVPKNTGLEGKNLIEESMKPATDLFKNWLDSYNASMKSLGAGDYHELTNKMVNGVNVYQNLNRFWDDLRMKITGESSSDPLKFYNEWKDEYMKIMSNNFIPYLPESIQTMFNEPIGIYGMYSDTNKKIYQPWVDSMQDARELLSKSMAGDKNAYIDFIKLWNQNFGATFGKLFDMPQLGMNSEQMQKQMDSLNTLTKFLNNGNEFMATMNKVNQETLEEMVKEYQVMYSEGTQPKTFKEFYNYWLGKNEAAYLKLFRTEDFAKLMGQVVDAGLNFKKNLDKTMEKQLDFLPFPKKADMDSLYKTVNDMRREIRTLRKEVNSLKTEKENTEKENKEKEVVDAKKATAKSTTTKSTTTKKSTVKED